MDKRTVETERERREALRREVARGREGLKGERKEEEVEENRRRKGMALFLLNPSALAPRFRRVVGRRRRWWNEIKTARPTAIFLIRIKYQ